MNEDKADRIVRKINAAIAGHEVNADHFEQQAKAWFKDDPLRSGAYWDAARRERAEANRLRGLLNEED